MRRPPPLQPFLFALVLACTSPDPVDDTGDSDTGDTADTQDTDTDVDTDTGTDADNDGWSVERGDCADTDVWIHPGWAERQDDRDNDCDGLVDEKLDAIVALQVDLAGAQTTRVHRISLLGEIDGTWDLAGGPAQAANVPWIADRPADAGWWLVSAADATLWLLSPSGEATVTWDAGADTGVEPAVDALYGAASLPDGSALVSSGDRLFAVTAAGVATPVASWSALELYVVAVAVDPRDGSAALFGAYGGLGTWSTAGTTILRQDDPFAPQAAFVDAVGDEQGRIFVLGDAVIGASVERGVFEWDRTSTDLVLAAPWKDSTGDAIDFVPAGLAMDTEADEFYVTANGGWFRTVWRLFPDDDYGSLLWPDASALQVVPPPEDEFRFVRGVGMKWTHD